MRFKICCVHNPHITLQCAVGQVEDQWKNTNFTVLAHGDSKDAFILGGTDDIQVGASRL